MMRKEVYLLLALLFVVGYLVYLGTNGTAASPAQSLRRLTLFVSQPSHAFARSFLADLNSKSFDAASNTQPSLSLSACGRCV